MELPEDIANKILQELVEWADKHGISFEATGDLFESCPVFESVMKKVL